ncbi:MAG: hypothetical protein OFPI_09080 [Osedax symbiont Rs2]|nr:MAG: hypothetical protein OFPI_09080 [Osedax symbiont Rs2]
MSLQQTYLHCQSLAAAKSHRQLLWLSGEQCWCYAQLRQLTQLLQKQQSIAVIDPINAAPGSFCQQHISAKECHKYLGFEHQTLVFDGYSGFNPDALAQISGTLIAAGVLILVTPDLEHWQEWADPELDKLWVQPYRKRDVSRYFLTWLKSNLLQDRQLTRYTQTAALETDYPTGDRTQVEYLGGSSLASADFAINPAALQYQLQLVTDIAQHISANSLSQTVVMADRGRGKSALLGLLAKQLAADKSIYLTAADALAVQQVQKFAGQDLTYHTPDKLLNNKFSLPDNSLLLIDEAAAISVEVLLRLVKKFRQCVFSSTMQGYEGTGQGFKLRFLAQLLNYSSDCKLFSLSLPMRWAQNDPLEGWLNKVLLLKVQGDDEVNVAATDSRAVIAAGKAIQSSLTIRLVSAAELIASPGTLQQLFSLLSQAHYRTTPGDLRIILDSPNMSLWLASCGQKIVGVCLVAGEGIVEQFPVDQQQMSGEQLAIAMHQGRRRPRGNLIPQMLIGQEGLLQAKSFKFARVVRIATLHSQRRAGIASKLLEKVQQWALKTNYHYLAANFSLQQDLIEFWLGQGFSFVRVGNQTDKITGSYNAMVLKPLQPQRQLFNCLRSSFSIRLAFQKRRIFSPKTDLSSLQALPVEQHRAADDGLDRAYVHWCKAQLYCFAYQQRPLESVAYLYYQLLQQYPQWTQPEVLNSAEKALVDSYFFDLLPLEKIYLGHKLSGYRQFVKSMRAIARLQLEQLADNLEDGDSRWN